ncbi:MAG: 50S ribosome-binding protein YggL [Thermodesulfobacteriota bacterium]|nr:50S ribosome-binding protein YggL [Thermodesulfobacteriota bacterium]
MKKRLRKKNHTGEFAQWGRQLIATRNTKMDVGAFHDAFTVEAIEDNGCYCGASISDDKIDVIIELGKISENPEGKFERITEWLDLRSDIEG